MKRYVLSGSPRELGESFGEAARDDIAELYRLRVANALAQAKEYGGRAVDERLLLDLSRACLPYAERFDPEGHAELAGIARGANLSVEQVLAMNGLTDLRDVLAFGDLSFRPEAEGCSSFLVQRDQTQGGRALLGQTWDLATDNMPFVVAVERRPAGRPRTWSLTTSGCLSLIGLSEAGVAVGTTNLRTTDSRTGVTYLQLIHRALSAPDVGEVERVITTARRAGAHYYYAADAGGRGVAIECTATRAQVTHVERGHHVHCNHVLDEGQRALEAVTPMASSHCRQARMGALLGAERAPLTPERVMALLADHDGGGNAICRHDFAGISSNGAMVMEPESRSAWIIHGPPCSGRWERLTP